MLFLSLVECFNICGRFFAYLETMPWGVDQKLTIDVGYNFQSLIIPVQGECTTFVHF
jgi:hypothetical protein